MSYGGYSQVGYDQSNPYDQRDTHDTGYSNYDGRYNDQPDVEMQPYSQSGGADPNAILNDCREVDRALDQINSQLDNLERAFKQSISRPDLPSSEITALSSQVMTEYRALVNRVKNIKSQPESGNPRNAPQVGRVDRRLKSLIQRYQNLEAEFRKDSQAAAERQYRIVRPDATEQEVREACADPDTPIFQQALLSSDRRGQAQSSLRNVKERHDAIQKIERQMVELAELFTDLDAIVVQQEPLVTDIERKGEEVHENVVKANVEIGGAIEKARSRNRKKWWCLLIVLLIIIVVVVIAVVVVEINKKK
jgi:syntaxin 1B/2/3